MPRIFAELHDVSYVFNETNEVKCGWRYEYIQSICFHF